MSPTTIRNCPPVHTHTQFVLYSTDRAAGLHAGHTIFFFSAQFIFNKQIGTRDATERCSPTTAKYINYERQS